MKTKMAWGLSLALFAVGAFAGEVEEGWGRYTLPRASFESVGIGVTKKKVEMMDFYTRSGSFAFAFSGSGRGDVDFTPSGMSFRFKGVEFCYQGSFFLTSRDNFGEEKIQTVWRQENFMFGKRFQHLTASIVYGKIGLNEGSNTFSWVKTTPTERLLFSGNNFSVQDMILDRERKSSGAGVHLAMEGETSTEQTFYFSGCAVTNVIFFNDFGYYSWDEGHTGKQFVSVNNPTQWQFQLEGSAALRLSQNFSIYSRVVAMTNTVKGDVWVYGGAVYYFQQLSF